MIYYLNNIFLFKLIIFDIRKNPFNKSNSFYKKNNKIHGNAIKVAT